VVARIVRKKGYRRIYKTRRQFDALWRRDRPKRKRHPGSGVPYPGKDRETAAEGLRDFMPTWRKEAPRSGKAVLEKKKRPQPNISAIPRKEGKDCPQRKSRGTAVSESAF